MIEIMPETEGKVLVVKATEKHDAEIQAIFKAIRQLMTPPEKQKKKIGYR